jgi:DNA polymerase I-like protein with 3'-5' exonuclease and polymerase domains
MDGDGPTGEVLVLGSSPHRLDMDVGQVFGSRSGQMVRRWCAAAGLQRVRFDYAVPFPAGNLDKNPHIPDVGSLVAAAQARIKLGQYKVIIACGEFALRAVTECYDRIEDVHCYVFDTPYGKVIPTFPPFEVMQHVTNAYWMKFAIQKAKHVLEGAVDKPLTIHANNSFEEAKAYIAGCSLSERVSIDIETNKFNPELTAIGVSYGPDSVLSVSRGDGLSDQQFNHLVQQIISIIEDPEIEKIGQNIMFDLQMLWKAYGCVPRGKIWDTMHAANVINCEIEKSLKALGRLYFYCEPWKGHWNTTGEKLRIYNAFDVGYTFRIALRQEAELERIGLSNYFSFVRFLFLPSFHLATRGIRMDTDAMKQMQGEVEAALAPFEAKAVEFAKPFVPSGEKKKKHRDPAADERVTVVGEIPAKERKNIYVAKKKDAKFGLEPGVTYRKAYKADIELFHRSFNPRSPSQLLGVLANAGIKIPKVKQASEEWGESTNDKALAKIVERGTDSPEVIAFVQHMRLLRQGQKLLSSYCKAALDDDGRWRCSYNVEGTTTGRSSTKKTPWGTGGNNQNIPRDGFAGIKFKRLFVADVCKTLFQSDQEQAEARVVAYLAGCRKLIELFETGKDIHEYAISSILGEDIRQFKEKDPDHYKKLRQYGKIVNHGGNYDMGPDTLSESAIKQGIILDPKTAKEFLNKRREVFPEVYNVWHKSVQEELKKSRTLWTPFGRRRIFMGIADHKMFREAYAFVPQSTVPHITNVMWLWASKQPGAEVLQHGHDALLIQVEDARLDLFVKAFIQETKTIIFECNGSKVIIPWDGAIGPSWGNMKKVEV